MPKNSIKYHLKLLKRLPYLVVVLALLGSPAALAQHNQPSAGSIVKIGVTEELGNMVKLEGVSSIVENADKGVAAGIGRELTEVTTVSAHGGLFNAISNGCWGSCTTGNNIISNGDFVNLLVGTYSGSPYAYSDRIYWSRDIYYTMNCVEDDHSCILDGLGGTRRILYVDGTSNQDLTITGIKFYNIRASYAGGIRAQSGAKVVIQLCLFDNLEATSSSSGYGGGGIIVDSSSTSVNIYTTLFSNNNAVSGKGDDIYIGEGSVTVHATCPPGFTGTSSQSSSLDTYTATSSATFSGTLNNFEAGTCSLSCEAGKYRTGTICYDCAAGKYSSAGAGATSCTR